MSEFNPNYKENRVMAKIGQKILIFNKKGEVLFLQRSDKCSRPHGWDLVGGGLDVGEGTYEGLEREVAEETQIKIQNIIPLHTQLETTDDGSSVLMIGYKGETVEEKPTPVLSWEHENYKWLSQEEALKVELPDFHSNTVKRAIENKF